MSKANGESGQDEEKQHSKGGQSLIEAKHTHLVSKWTLALFGLKSTNVTRTRLLTGQEFKLDHVEYVAKPFFPG